MENGLGVLGWGVGGIETEAPCWAKAHVDAHPASWLRLTGRDQDPASPPPTSCSPSPDAAQARRGRQVRRVLRPRGGRGAAGQPRTLGNSPNSSFTAAIFPIDEETINYLRLTGPPRKPAPSSSPMPRHAGRGANPIANRWSRVPEAGPVHRRALDLGPEASAGPHRAVRREERVPQDIPTASWVARRRLGIDQTGNEAPRRPSRPPDPAKLTFCAGEDAIVNYLNGEELQRRPAEQAWSLTIDERGAFVLDRRRRRRRHR